MLPSCAGGEKNSTSVERLVKKSFRKNSASFKKTNKAVSAGKKKKLDTGFFSFVINYFLPDRYSVEEASGRHEGSTPEEPDPTQDTCELPSLSAEDQKHKGGHSRDQTRPGFMRRGSAGLLTILE